MKSPTTVDDHDNHGDQVDNRQPSNNTCASQHGWGAQSISGILKDPFSE